MKKLFYLLFIPALFLSSCSASYGSGGFLVPLLTGFGAVVFGYKALKSAGDTKKAMWLYSVVCAVVTIVILIAFHFDK